MDQNSSNQVPNSPQSTTKLIVGGLILLTVLIAVGLMLGMIIGNSKPRTPASTIPAPVALVSINQDGFVPTQLNISKGTKVTWINSDDDPHHVASNPHPEHTNTPGLDTKVSIEPKSDYSFTFDKTGTYHYHDHLNPGINGTITVK